MTMIGMLAVLFLIMTRAKDPNTWRWLTNEYPVDQSDRDDGNGRPDGSQSDEPTNAAASGQTEPLQHDATDTADREADKSVTAEPTGPTDLDPEEADAAQEEFQAISDRQPLLPEETPSYRRLINWVKNQPGDLLRRRSEKNVFFTDFVEVPDKRRGKLVHLRLHTWGAHVLEASDNPPGIGQLYEVRGWTDQSGPWMYIVVAPDWPPGMPIGPNAREEASFDGYFLKLMSYEAAESPGKPLFAPLLVGRLVWHPVATQSGAASDGTWFLVTALGGGLIVLVAILRWVLRSSSAPLTAGTYSGQSNSTEIEDWLERAKTDAGAGENDYKSSEDAQA